MDIYIFRWPRTQHRQQQHYEYEDSQHQPQKIVRPGNKTGDGPIPLDRNRSVSMTIRCDAKRNAHTQVNSNLECNDGGILGDWMWCSAISKYVPVFCLVYHATDCEQIKVKLCLYRKMHSYVGRRETNERKAYLPVGFRSHQNILSEFLCGVEIKLNK